MDHEHLERVVRRISTNHFKILAVDPNELDLELVSLDNPGDFKKRWVFDYQVSNHDWMMLIDGVLWEGEDVPIEWNVQCWKRVY